MTIHFWNNGICGILTVYLASKVWRVFSAHIQNPPIRAAINDYFYYGFFSVHCLVFEMLKKRHSKFLRYLNNCHTQQRKTPNHHIWEAGSRVFGNWLTVAALSLTLLTVMSLAVLPNIAQNPRTMFNSQCFHVKYIGKSVYDAKATVIFSFDGIVQA